MSGNGKKTIYLNPDRRNKLEQIVLRLGLESINEAVYLCLDRGISTVLEKTFQSTVTEVTSHV
jgi:hypothetical protein